MKAKEKVQFISKEGEKNQKRFNVSSREKINNSPENNVSIFTKSTNPKVIIQSENINNKSNLTFQNIHRHQVLRTCCLIVMCVILLMIFFLSLKTYDTIQKLAEYILL